MHRIKINPGVKIETLTGCFYNSLSFAFTEILGRSYGGGVLELMPSEVKRIVLPFSENNNGLLDEIDQMLRNKKDIINILEFTDEMILKNGFGLSTKDIKLAHSIWSKLSQRRINRSKR